MNTCKECGAWVDAADGEGFYLGDWFYCEDCVPEEGSVSGAEEALKD